MNIPEILRELGFGVRQLSFEDFETACDRVGFKYFLTQEKIGEGLTFPRTRNGKRYRIIVLQSTLFYQSLLETAWHEFTHAYFEHYGVRLFARGSEEKCERQAEDLALCCLIPTIWVRTKSREELLEEGFTPEQIDRRKYIYDSRGF
jgi:Domain of unknown function (DUF955).